MYETKEVISQLNHFDDCYCINIFFNEENTQLSR